MTSEEMERAIEFLLQSQAKSEAQAEQTSQQVAALAKTHEEFTGFVRSHIEAQGEINRSLRETVRALTIAQARTDERLGDLESRSGQG
jgi:hypothetical protein